MSGATRFRVPADKVVHETIDGEAILIQLDTGCYYSLAGTGAEVWALLGCDASRDEIVAHLRRRYAAAPTAELGPSVDTLLRDLAAEDLIEPDGVAPPASEDAGPAEPPAATGWSPPRLEKFTDMQDFLRLDPIHEVDEAGWPHARAVG